MDKESSLNWWREWLNDQELFARNSEAIGKLLRESGAGHSAEYYKSQLCTILSREEIDKIAAEKKAILEDPYKEIRKGYNVFDNQA